MAVAVAPPVDDALPEPHEVESDTAQLALFEGQKVLENRLSFSGNIVIADPDLIAALTLGEEVVVKIGGYVSTRGHKLKRGKDKGTNGSVSHHTIVVQSVAPLE